MNLILAISIFMLLDSLPQVFGGKGVFDRLFGEGRWRHARLASAITYLAFALIFLSSQWP